MDPARYASKVLELDNKEIDQRVQITLSALSGILSNFGYVVGVVVGVRLCCFAIFRYLRSVHLKHGGRVAPISPTN